MSSAAPVAPGEQPATPAEPVSLFTAYRSLFVLNVDQFEAELMGLYGRASLGEIEALAERLEIEKAISLQQMEQTA